MQLVPVSELDFSKVLLLIRTPHPYCHQFHQRHFVPSLFDSPIRPLLLLDTRPSPRERFGECVLVAKSDALLFPPLNLARMYLSPPFSRLFSLSTSSFLLCTATNANFLLMPQLSVLATGTDPDIVQGPRKRRPTERVIENGDPLARKKVRTTSGTTVNARAIPATPQAFIEEIPDITSRLQHLPPCARQSSGAPHSSEDSSITHTQSTMDVIEVNTSSDDNSDDKQSDDEPEAEDDISELSKIGVHSYPIARCTETSIDRLSKSWDAPVYVFFKPTPSVQYINKRKVHVFECAASPCRYRTKFVRRFLYTSDASSTSNLRRHARFCWGEDALAAADETRDVKTAREALGKHKGLNGSITAAFKRVGMGKVTYSHRQHTKLESRHVPVLFLTGGI